MTDVNPPIDALHAECVTAKFAIRKEVENRRASVSTWEPRPMPSDFIADRRFDRGK